MLLPLHRAFCIFGPLAAVLVLSMPTFAAAEATPASLDPSDSDAPPAEWGISGAVPQTGSTPHTSGRAFASEPKVRVVIDKTAQEMTVLIDEVESYVWKVSTGLPGYATPSGTYVARSMNEMWYSREWDDAPMPHSIFFTKRGHAIHGTDETGKLGNPASHGCVRLAPENAAILFDLVKDGGLANTTVVLTGLTPGGESPPVAQSSPRKQKAASKRQRVQARVERNEFEKRRLFGGRSLKRHRQYQSPKRAFGLGPRPFYRRY